MDSLGEKLILLVAGFVLTGLLVPFLKSRLDEASLARKLQLEARLARQNELIQSQIRLLNDFSDNGWRLLFEAFKVSYAFAWESAETAALAVAAYSPLSWELFATLRATISKSARLVSPATYERALRTYDWLIVFDDQLSTMVEGTSDAQTWVRFHQDNFDAGAKAMDATIRTLATELDLAARLSIAGTN